MPQNSQKEIGVKRTISRAVGYLGMAIQDSYADSAPEANAVCPGQQLFRRLLAPRRQLKEQPASNTLNKIRPQKWRSKCQTIFKIFAPLHPGAFALSFRSSRRQA
jgi:hypothetical protein